MWIIPKYIFGKPVDQLRNDPRIPFKVRQRFIQQMMRSYAAARAIRAAQAGPPLRRGSPDGLRAHPRPHPARHDHAQAEHRVAAGLAGALRRRQQPSRPTSSSTAPATRSRSRSSTRSFISAPDNHIELFRRVFHPEIPNVFFVGLLQPLGAIMPLAEAQGAWVGDHLRGDYALPPAAQVRADIDADQAACASATSPPSATRSRSTSTTTSTPWTRSAPRASSARAPTASGRRAMPTFCRHNRFIDRCPICSKTLPGNSPAERATPGRARPRRRAASARPRRRRGAARRCACATRSAPSRTATPRRWFPGLRASADAARLAEEIAFSNGRLLRWMRSAEPDPPQQLYGDVKSLLPAGDIEQARWVCFLVAYLCPLEGRGAVRRHPCGAASAARAAAARPRPTWRSGRAPRTTRARLAHAGRLPPVGRRRRASPGSGLRRRRELDARSAASSGCSSASRCPA